MEKNDGWRNLFTLAGTARDRTVRGSFKQNPILDRETLDSLYSSSGVAKRIIDIAALDSLREWFFTDDEKSELLQDRFEEMNLHYHLQKFLISSRLHGGAIMILLIDDGLSLEQELNEKAIESIEGFRVYDRWSVSWSQEMLNHDPNSKDFGEPEFFDVTPNFSTPFRVHASRVLRLDGLIISDRKKRENSGWGYSFLQPIYQYLMDLDQSHRASASIIQDYVQTVLSVKGLTEMLSTDGEKNVLKRLEILDLSRSVLNTLLLDSDGEQFSKQASSVSGLGDLLEAFRLQISSACGIPMTKLFGVSPKGLNATGDSDIRMYYDEVSNYQKVFLKPQLERLISLFMKEKSGPYQGVEPENWSFSFNSLWQLGEREKSEIKKMVAETDAIYLDRGVFHEKEIADVRSQPEGFKKHIELQTTYEESK